MTDSPACHYAYDRRPSNAQQTGVDYCRKVRLRHTLKPGRPDNALA